MEFSVLTWNVGRINNYSAANLRMIISEIKRVNPDVICLQEMPNAEGHFKGFKGYKAIIPWNNTKARENYNYNIILSKLKVSKIGKIGFSEISKKLQDCTWVEIKIGSRKARVYNCHFGIMGVGVKERVAQLGLVMKEASNFKGPKIICGDLNTNMMNSKIKKKLIMKLSKCHPDSMKIRKSDVNESEKTLFMRKAARNGYREAIGLDKPTWCLPILNYELFKLKLDWFLYKGIKIRSTELGDYVSDHRSIFAVCKLKGE